MIRYSRLFYPLKGGLCLALIIVTVLPTLPEKADAQATQAFRLAEGFVRIAEPGQLADTLSVWGDVNAPGSYIIPRGSTVHEVISYARGPVQSTSAGQNLDWNKFRLEITISRYSTQTGEENTITFVHSYNEPYPTELREFVLRNDDIIAIEGKRKPAFIDWLRVFSTVIGATATTIIVIDRLSN